MVRLTNLCARSTVRVVISSLKCLHQKRENQLFDFGMISVLSEGGALSYVNCNHEELWKGNPLSI